MTINILTIAHVGCGLSQSQRHNMTSKCPAQLGPSGEMEATEATEARAASAEDQPCSAAPNPRHKQF